MVGTFGKMAARRGVALARILRPHLLLETQRVENAAEHELQVTAQQGIGLVRKTLVRHAGGADTGALIKQLGAQMCQAADAIGAIVQLAGVGLGYSMNSRTLLAGTFGLTTSTIGMVASSQFRINSLRTSIGLAIPR